MADASSAGAVSPTRPRPVLGPILSTVAFTFATYLTIGLSLAVLPGFVHNRLGYGALVAGLAISMQYVATLLSRARAGRMADVLGPRRTVLTGLAMCAVSGGVLMAGASAMAMPALSLGLILLARLALGCAESSPGAWARSGTSTPPR
jgi:MFS family permease